MTTKEQFDKWFDSPYGEGSTVGGQFETDCEIALEVYLTCKDKNLLKVWMRDAFKAGYNAALEEVIPKVLYGDIDETPFEEIKDHCKLNEQGEIDWFWVSSLDEEQQTRMAIAATLRAMKE